MPFGRRHGGKTSGGNVSSGSSRAASHHHHQPQQSQTGQHNHSDSHTEQQSSWQQRQSHQGNDHTQYSGWDSMGAAMPRHPTLPDLPSSQGDVFFECTLFLYSGLALVLQYLNLYKTMWWLPNSHTHYALKFYLIDPYLFSCLGLILGRRVTWCFLKKISIIPPGEEDNLPGYVYVIEWILKVPMVCAVFTSFMYSFVRVLAGYPWSSLLYLTYPMVVYLFLFYNELLGIFKGGSLGRVVNNFLSFAQSPPYLVDPALGHACSSSPNRIREEADLLVLDIAQRAKQTFFSAFTVAYFSVYVPACFTPESLCVDNWWVLELGFVVFMTSLSLYLTYLTPIHYCDSLHRAASHLGSWEKMESVKAQQIGQMPYQHGSFLWADGLLVKHDKNVYKGSGSSIAAEPGNASHFYFYMVSGDPLFILNFLCVLEAVLILIQFLMLVHSTDWQHIVTLVLLMFANYLLLFKLFKDKVILGRIYHPSPEDEALIHK